ncbi:cytochrome c oxidase subunit 6a [Capronia coronata CBS 617.96]|uniref:Cytochrome c oxidase subunit 13, mitochondrial n=1 Tax=Capronia coronata CBS 617.96 TaxID=1182541 RepID=W9XXZ5_9EURO|nr:cytochrome c oxidase subunit 6a [Capronia coronata CBS 617.96]EXJ81831.1 cytochrome c oxidase subunit 6a [Capronia coronata CBS 617.96]
MSFQRVGLRFAQQLRSPAFRPALRSTLQRRFASAPAAPGQGSSKLVGTADNAFNRERAAVKAHAAATSDLWRKLSIYVVIPCLILGGINAWNLWNEHWEHWEHLPPLEERVEYPYQNLRTKNFFFGDGDKTLFWNDKVNYHKKDKQT